MSILDVAIVGGGQSGLAMSYALKRAGIAHVILEAGERPEGSWPHYYDSLTLFSPARYSALPGLPFPGDGDRHPKRDEVSAYLNAYASYFSLPVRLNARVQAVTNPSSGCFELKLTDGEIVRARSVVAASGTFGTPYMPRFAGQDRFRGKILHSSDYRSPRDFQGKRVVVVGSANSAVQIAVELASVANVTLAAREKVKYMPQRVLGRDIHFWFHWTGLDNTRLMDQGGAVLDDGKYRKALKSGSPDRRSVFRSMTETGVVWPDGETEQVDAIIMATGYRPSVPFLASLPVIDSRGFLVQKDGVALNVPGLFFIGYPGLRNFASGALRGVGIDSQRLVPRIEAYLAGYANAADPVPWQARRRCCAA